MDSNVRTIERLLNVYHGNKLQRPIKRAKINKVQLKDYLNNPQPYLAQIIEAGKETKLDMQDKAAKIFYYRNHNKDVFNLIDKFSREISN